MGFAQESAAQATAAQKLAVELGLTCGSASSVFVAGFDQALATWIESYRLAVEVPYRPGRPLPGLDDTLADQTLRSTLQSAREAERTYAWARMWLAEDALRPGFRLSITGPRLGKHIETIKPAPRAVKNAVVPLISFFGGAWQDSGLYDELWRLFKPAYATDRDVDGLRDQTLSFFVRLNERRVFFNTFQGLRRILDRARSRDAECIRHLMGFSPQRPHGAGIFAGHLIRALGFDLEDARPGKINGEALAWFSDSGGKTPGQKWHDRRVKLEADLPFRALEGIAEWVRDHPELRYFGDKPYRDELYWRVWKSASWLLGRTP